MQSQNGEIPHTAHNETGISKNQIMLTTEISGFICYRNMAYPVLHKMTCTSNVIQPRKKWIAKKGGIIIYKPRKIKSNMRLLW